MKSYFVPLVFTHNITYEYHSLSLKLYIFNKQSGLSSPSEIKIKFI